MLLLNNLTQATISLRFILGEYISLYKPNKKQWIKIKFIFIHAIILPLIISATNARWYQLHLNTQEHHSVLTEVRRLRNSETSYCAKQMLNKLLKWPSINNGNIQQRLISSVPNNHLHVHLLKAKHPNITQITNSYFKRCRFNNYGCSDNIAFSTLQTVHLCRYKMIFT